MASTARVAAFVVFCGAIAVIVAVTTMPWSVYYVGHSHWAHVEWVPFTRWVRPLDVVLNIALFIPLGASAAAAWSSPDPGSTARRRRAIVAGACLLSVSVELFQVYCHGRLPTTTDVLTNTLGAWLGTRLWGWRAQR